jgi:hypothetical protein
MRFLMFAIALYVVGCITVDAAMFNGRYRQAFWYEAGKQVRWTINKIGLL